MVGGGGGRGAQSSSPASGFRPWAALQLRWQPARPRPSAARPPAGRRAAAPPPPPASPPTACARNEQRPSGRGGGGLLGQPGSAGAPAAAAAQHGARAATPARMPAGGGGRGAGSGAAAALRPPPAPFSSGPPAARSRGVVLHHVAHPEVSVHKAQPGLRAVQGGEHLEQHLAHCGGRARRGHARRGSPRVRLARSQGGERLGGRLARRGRRGVERGAGAGGRRPTRLRPRAPAWRPASRLAKSHARGARLRAHPPWRMLWRSGAAMPACQPEPQRGGQPITTSKGGPGGPGGPARPPTVADVVELRRLDALVHLPAWGGR